MIARNLSELSGVSAERNRTWAICDNRRRTCRGVLSGRYRSAAGLELTSGYDSADTLVRRRLTQRGDQMDWETEFSLTIAGEIATSTATRISGAIFQSVDAAGLDGASLLDCSNMALGRQRPPLLLRYATTCDACQRRMRERANQGLRSQPAISNLRLFRAVY